MDYTEVKLYFEFMDYDLKKFLDKFQSTISPEVIKSIIYQLLCGLNYLHLNRIIHRDIKPQVFFMIVFRIGTSLSIPATQSKLPISVLLAVSLILSASTLVMYYSIHSSNLGCHLVVSSSRDFHGLFQLHFCN